MSERFPGVMVKTKSANRKLSPVKEVTHDVRDGQIVKLKRSRYTPHQAKNIVRQLRRSATCWRLGLALAKAVAAPKKL